MAEQRRSTPPKDVRSVSPAPRCLAGGATSPELRAAGFRESRSMAPRDSRNPRTSQLGRFHVRIRSLPLSLLLGPRPACARAPASRSARRWPACQGLQLCQFTPDRRMIWIRGEPGAERLPLDSFRRRLGGGRAEKAVIAIGPSACAFSGYPDEKSRATHY